MSAQIGPGDVLECVDAHLYEEGGEALLTLGAHYTVEAVWDYLPHRGDPDSGWFDCAVDLVGVAPPADGLAWGLYRFRPVDSSRADFITSLKQPAPERVFEPI